MRCCRSARPSGRFQSDAASCSSTLVMRGLDPRIHHLRDALLLMDCRVKPGNDGCKTNRRPRGPPIVSYQSLRSLTRSACVLEDRAKQPPALAIELHHLKLLVDAIVGRRGVERTAGSG